MKVAQARCVPSSKLCCKLRSLALNDAEHYVSFDAEVLPIVRPLEIGGVDAEELRAPALPAVGRRRLRRRRRRRGAGGAGAAGPVRGRRRSCFGANLAKNRIGERKGLRSSTRLSFTHFCTAPNSKCQ